MSKSYRAWRPKKWIHLRFILETYDNNEFAEVMGNSCFRCQKKLDFLDQLRKDKSNIKQNNGIDEVIYYSNLFMKVIDSF